jgi:hypothetical protein
MRLIEQSDDGSTLFCDLCGGEWTALDSSRIIENHPGDFFGLALIFMPRSEPERLKEDLTNASE